MSKPIESFFDIKVKNFSLWEKPSGDIVIDEKDILFQAPMHRVLNDNMAESRKFYFVLTQKYLFMLKSEEEPRILRVMNSKWVRCDYQKVKNEEGSAESSIFTILFIRNMRYTKLFTLDSAHFTKWKQHLCKVFLQCDFHDKFHTLKMIGKGSFARVYLVQNKENGRRYAVKAFSKEYLLSQNKGKESLINEIEVMQRLNHEFVMNLEEIHESKNSIYLVLELLEGGELLNYISVQNKLSLRDCHRIIYCILSALAYMDEKKIMHRDLKPDNMILKKKEPLSQCTLKLVDFGLATKHDIDEYLYKRCGTPGFVAPEVINAPSNQNIHYDPKCDVFSTGVIFYILLTEKSPFDGRSFKEILQKNKKCNIDFDVKQLNTNSPAVDLLKKMLIKDPVKRLSAKQALKHPFFSLYSIQNPIESKEESVVLHSDAQKFRDMVQKQKQMQMDINIEGSSLIVRKQVINGEVISVTDTSSMIHSLRSMSNPKKLHNSDKRTSILKYVLLNNQGDGYEIYNSGFVNEDTH